MKCSDRLSLDHEVDGRIEINCIPDGKAFARSNEILSSLLGNNFRQF